MGAGESQRRCAGCGVGLASILFFVIPAKAGIQLPPFKFILPVLDPRLRGGYES
jgi:hypothetical protein